MTKIKMHTPDLVAENLEKIAALLPSCVTEVKDEKSGKLTRKIDFDQLRQELSDHIVEGPRERYHLDWPGKRDALLAANAPIAKTLRPCRAESVDFDMTKNLFIEGDNLDALKLLQETYLGKIKMIYIDPPYNTGKDFIYKDSFADNTSDYLLRSSQEDENGGRMVANQEINGRFHSQWLSMMYPRLRLARSLLREDGLLFVSIGDHEVSNLRKMCAEIFGEKNFCAQFVWNTEGNTDNQYHIKVNHEYIVVFYKDARCADAAVGSVIDPNTPKESNLWKGLADNNVNKNNSENPPAILELPAGFPSVEEKLVYKKKEVDEAFFEQTLKDGFISDDVKKQYSIEPKSGLPVKLDDMVVENFRLVKPCRVYVGMANRNKLEEFIKAGCKPINDNGTALRFYLNRNAGIRYARDNETPSNILSVLRGFGTTERTRTYLKQLGIAYDYPKPVALIEYLIKIGCERDGIVLDFFAGSGTTAEAVIKLNLETDSARRFICVQVSEDSGGNSNSDLAELARRRLVTVFGRLKNEHPLLAGNVGFRYLRVSSSSVKDVHHSATELSQKQLDIYVDNLKEDRNAEDLLFQILIDYGVDLSLPIEKSSVGGKDVFVVDQNALIACFERDISESLVKDLANRKPLRAVFRDSSYATDSAKINVEQIFKLLSPETEVRTL